MDDTLIIELFKKQDNSAIKEAEKKYGSLLMKIAVGVLCLKEEAEEVVNDTLLAAFNNIKDSPPENLSAYLCKITRNLAIKKYRYNKAEKRSSEYTLSLEEIGDIFSAPDTPEDILISNELRDYIFTYIKSLPKEKRLIFLRRYWFFDSISEISSTFAISESKVKTLLFRIRKGLKEYLKKEGYAV